MSEVVAAVDNSPAARSVLATARAFGRLLDEPVSALHAREDGVRTVVAEAEAAGLPLRILSGGVVDVLVAAAETGVDALVVGARDTPGGPRPAGHVALQVIRSSRTPVVVVPPGCEAGDVARVLVPLDASKRTSDAVWPAVASLGAGGDLDVVVLHVRDEASLPPFSDQPQHEYDAWKEEFAARYCDVPAARLHVRVRVGVPGDCILETTGETGADVVVLGWSQEISEGRAAVVLRLLERSVVPVMFVPADPPLRR